MTKRLPSLLACLGSVFLLASCTGSQSGAGPTVSDASTTNGVIEGARDVNTSCYYAPLPGAFRIYCPGPKQGSGCGSVPASAKASYLTGAGAEATASIRALTAAEGSAMPDLCVAFELDLLPNSDNKLTYQLGRDQYHVYSYLAYGDGVTVP